MAKRNFIRIARDTKIGHTCKSGCSHHTHDQNALYKAFWLSLIQVVCEFALAKNSMSGCLVGIAVHDSLDCFTLLGLWILQRFKHPILSWVRWATIFISAGVGVGELFAPRHGISVPVLLAAPFAIWVNLQIAKMIQKGTQGVLLAACFRIDAGSWLAFIVVGVWSLAGLPYGWVLDKIAGIVILAVTARHVLKHHNR